ncbi:hypothetical protein PUN28_005319 [Cardiocondyla obscurior]|uniref:Uncharacterized protein n=1 Tax=Cardiocondyla obscurior TaxID=286306 RepID=A0AAW2GKE1_9HYME
MQRGCISAGENRLDGSENRSDLYSRKSRSSEAPKKRPDTPDRGRPLLENSNRCIFKRDRLIKALIGQG